jgi:hypothetical protein
VATAYTYQPDRRRFSKRAAPPIASRDQYLKAPKA